MVSAGKGEGRKLEIKGIINSYKIDFVLTAIICMLCVGGMFFFSPSVVMIVLMGALAIGFAALMFNIWGIIKRLKEEYPE